VPKTPDQWIQLIKHGFKLCGEESESDVAEMLLFPAAGADGGVEQGLMESFREPILALIIRTAVAKQLFTSAEHLIQTFGTGMQGRFRGYYLDLARAYWSYRLAVDDLRREHPELLLTSILSSAEVEFASLFFPSPGPAAVPRALRKNIQLQVLSRWAPEWDISTFMAQNPTARSGCLAAVALLLIHAVVRV